jgi:hypothetical protein
VCGLAYGAAVELMMTFVVLPLSALHAGARPSFVELAQGLLGHMLDIGLPIALSVSRFAPQVASGASVASENPLVRQLPSHSLGCLDAQQVEATPQHAGRQLAEREP